MFHCKILKGDLRLTNINLIVNGAKARAEVDGILTTGSIGIPVTIQYDSSWDGLTKHLVCTSGKWGPTGKTRTMLNVETASTVAHEVMIADNHLYLGIEGRNRDGSVVVPTVWADCGTIFTGAHAGADLSAKPTLPIWAQLQSQINDLKKNSESIENTDNGSSNTAKLTSAQIAALDGMFKVCAFTKADISAEYTAFKTAFEITDSSDAEGGEDSGGETVHTYAVTNNLTNVTTDNTVAEIAEGGSYSATLTIADGYTLKSLVITHNGEDVTDAVYGEGYILITNVSGDIVITAVAEEPVEIPMTESTSQYVSVYSDDGTSKLKNAYFDVFTSNNATETDASVTVEVTNSGDSDRTDTIYIGCDGVRYAIVKTVTLGVGESVRYEYTVKAGQKLAVCTPNASAVIARAYGSLDVYQPTAEYPVTSKQVTTVKTYSDGTADTLLKSANYQYVVHTSEVFAEDTDLIVSLVGGESDITIAGTDWYCGSVDPTNLATVYHGVKMGGSTAMLRVGQVQKYTYTVKAGYAFAICNVNAALTADRVCVETA